MPAGLDDAFASIIREQVAAVLDEKLSLYLGPPKRPARVTLRAVSSTPEPPSDWRTFEEVAVALRRTTRTIRRWVADGKLKTCGPDGRHISLFELERCMAQTRGDKGGEGVDEIVDRLMKKK